MNTISSTILLDSLLTELKGYIAQELKQSEVLNFYSSSRVSIQYLEVLLRQPIVLYIGEKNLIANTPIDDNQFLLLLQKVHFVPNYIFLIYVYLTYNAEERRNKQITCVLIETKKNVAKADALYNLIFVDFFLEKSKKNNTSGKIDYDKLEKKFHNTFSNKEYKRLLKKPGKYFYQSLLGLNVHRQL